VPRTYQENEATLLIRVTKNLNELFLWKFKTKLEKLLQLLFGFFENKFVSQEILSLLLMLQNFFVHFAI
jgi:hypothetical protein